MHINKSTVTGFTVFYWHKTIFGFTLPREWKFKQHARTTCRFNNRMCIWSKLNWPVSGFLFMSIAAIDFNTSEKKPTLQRENTLYNVVTCYHNILGYGFVYFSLPWLHVHVKVVTFLFHLLQYIHYKLSYTSYLQYNYIIFW